MAVRVEKLEARALAVDLPAIRRAGLGVAGLDGLGVVAPGLDLAAEAVVAVEDLVVDGAARGRVGLRILLLGDHPTPRVVRYCRAVLRRSTWVTSRSKPSYVNISRRGPAVDPPTETTDETRRARRSATAVLACMALEGEVGGRRTGRAAHWNFTGLNDPTTRQPDDRITGRPDHRRVGQPSAGEKPVGSRGSATGSWRRGDPDPSDAGFFGERREPNGGDTEGIVEARRRHVRPFGF